MKIDTTLYMACQDIKELVYIRKSTTVKALPLRLIPEAITHPIPACRALSLSLSLSFSFSPAAPIAHHYGQYVLAALMMLRIVSR